MAVGQTWQSKAGLSLLVGYIPALLYVCAAVVLWQMQRLDKEQGGGAVARSRMRAA